MIIDSHHHFWKFVPTEYEWITESMSVIRRDFGPDDLKEAMLTAGVDGVISVQARQSLEETHTLLRIAGENKFIRGVVGWVPLASDRVRHDLEMVGTDPKLRAVRHGLQDPEGEQMMLRDDFNRGVSLLKEFGLTYDLLVIERQLPGVLRFVDRHPEQTFVLDHIAKPKIKAAEREPWARLMVELAQRPNIFCKVSGMVTEADWQSWTQQGLREYFDVVVQVFTPARLMAGSDWPVCLVACGYKRWWDILREWTADWTKDDREAFFSGNAIRAYRLK